ncbi:DUF4292 domain-containing protein [Flavobacterium agrisoli]|uniref:DUF4292 domain-containing protein n=1 Tax=Flavobacterium agrisoli TaxID=2793066 RepID=A0A934UJL9_9FLAO|nr:DUF4292 domain-containing protein [Flavobacterium agrisoli]MBK0369555.1 DUF4292 domain-containing protein [Flavobacterium agrisoli]
MKKYILFIGVLLLSLTACKTKQATTSEAVTVEDLATKKIIDKHYENPLDFKTLYIKASAKYIDQKQNQNVTAEIKIEKDKQILVSVRFLGITMAKALITPTSVSYYEKIKGSYYEGDFTSLSKWLGTELNFEKVQNLLIGEALDNLKNGKYKQIDAAPLYRLDDQKESALKQSYYFDSEQFLLQKEQITQTAENIMIQVAYGNHKKFEQGNLPTSVTINTIQPKGKTDINLDYNSVSFNEELSFPYSIPDGYKKVIIK